MAWRLQPLLCAVLTTAPFVREIVNNVKCPKDEMDTTDLSYPLRSGVNVKFLVEAQAARC